MKENKKERRTRRRESCMCYLKLFVLVEDKGREGMKERGDRKRCLWVQGDYDHIKSDVRQ